MVIDDSLKWIVRIFLWGCTVLFGYFVFKFYTLDSVGGMIFSFIVSIPFAILAIRFEYLDWQDRQMYKKAERNRQERVEKAMQQYKDGTWDFPVKKFYEECIKNDITNLNAPFYIEKAKRLAVKIMQEEFVPVPEEYHGRYTQADRLRKLYKQGKDAVQHISEIEQRKKDEWNRVPHKATPNREEMLILTLASDLVAKRGVEKRQFMLNDNLKRLTDEIVRKREGQEALKKVSTLLYSSTYQEKKSDWAILGGIVSGIAGPVAGAAVAMDTIANNVEIDRANRERRAAVGRVAADIYKSAGDLDVSINDLENAKELLSQEILQTVEKVILPNVKTEDIWKCLNVSDKNVYQSETHVLKISTTIENHFNPKVPKKVHITVDGILSAKVYCDETLVATTIVPLPIYGVECHSSETFQSLCDHYMEGDRTYKVVYEPIALWAMEM